MDTSNLESPMELAEGLRMPRVGFGLFRVDPAEAESVAAQALTQGYRLIDTAQAYGNEAEAGRAIRNFGIPRDEIFVTTKMRRNIGETTAQKDFDRSFEALGLGYINLVLVHMPIGDVFGTWRVLERELRRGRVRAIGVSNFDAARLQDLMSNSDIKPVLDQFQSNPYHQAQETLEFCQKQGIIFQAWSPLAQGADELFAEPALKEIAAAHARSVAQIILRWQLQRNISFIAKSTHEARMRENLDLFGFELTDAEMGKISALGRAGERNLFAEPAFIAHLSQDWHSEKD
ncbi:MAG: aldo/keto reductase [Atopobiaceae bacterium]